jgi:hypothetical protein
LPDRARTVRHDVDRHAGIEQYGFVAPLKSCNRKAGKPSLMMRRLKLRETARPSRSFFRRPGTPECV